MRAVQAREDRFPPEAESGSIGEIMATRFLAVRVF